MFVPKIDKGFMPCAVVINKFNDEVSKASEKQLVKICLERLNGKNYIYEIQTFKDGTGHDEENYRIVERIAKTMLWFVGGYKFYISGSLKIYEKLAKDYSLDGARSFDYKFMSKVYHHEFEVVYTDTAFPELKEEKIPMRNSLNGCRIGFDAGGSDRKVSAVINGEVVFSDETVWFPKINEDPEYHYEGILDSISRAAAYMPRVDAIGVSTAGICVDNELMVSSIYYKVPEDKLDSKATGVYKRIAKLYNDCPLVVANDGDVTALAGAMDLEDDSVLGIAMGTSEAGGYIGKDMYLLGWLNELAFAPVDFNPDAMMDEWSLDKGCGVKYFSQDSVIKLAQMAGIKLDPEDSPARKLKVVQEMNEKGSDVTNAIFEDIGIYLGYTIAYYAMFYDLKHVLLLGRVVSGKGGNTILAKAEEVLYKEFPNLKHIKLHMPDEKSRRVGQSIAAASLPVVEE